MERFREVNFKSDISFFYDLEKHIKTDTSFDMDESVFMCWTENNPVFEQINQFVERITGALGCKHSRSCYTVQTTIDSHLPVHIDKDDSLVGHTSVHSNVYSLIIPIIGKASTRFYQLHTDDLGPDITDVDQRYALYINDPNMSTKLPQLSSITINTPTVLNISYPHSVNMFQAPRITYHVKLLQCKHNIREIGNILSVL
tara:strand:+ start:1788 stop:2387 length:600 start_codon:yes stop_codon:yes gene_type:complete